MEVHFRRLRATVHNLAAFQHSVSGSVTPPNLRSLSPPHILSFQQTPSLTTTGRSSAARAFFNGGGRLAGRRRGALTALARPDPVRVSMAHACNSSSPGPCATTARSRRGGRRWHMCDGGRRPPNLELEEAGEPTPSTRMLKWSTQSSMS
jgi:hypothetical protein